jgi:prepilin-type processing-associated H-X9-DG protein
MDVGRRHRALTLLELVVVIGILVILLAIGGSSISAARKQGRRLACLSNQRQIALAMHAYAVDCNDTFPISQYFDLRNGAFVTWDTTTEAGPPIMAKPGLIWEYVDGGAVQQCPSYEGPSLTAGDAFTGYNYNTTYLGRGEGEGPHRGFGTAPAKISQVRFTRAALVGDGGWSAGTNKFMRAPMDSGVAEATIHAGAQAYRHLDKTNVAFLDGHGESREARYRKAGAQRTSDDLLGWPENGFLSADDQAYAHR